MVQEKGGNNLDEKLRIFRDVLTNMNIQVHGGDGHPPPHSLQRVPSTGPTMSQSTRTPWTSSSSLIFMIIDVTQALESGPPEEQKHVKLPVA